MKANGPLSRAAQQAPSTVARPAAFPALMIELRLEAAPRVRLFAMNDSEEARLREWLDARAEIRELIEQALALERRAA